MLRNINFSAILCTIIIFCFQTGKLSRVRSAISRDVSVVNQFKALNATFDIEKLKDYPDDLNFIISQIMCAGANVDGNYPNPFNCNQFYMCAAGLTYLMQCPSNLLYDPNPDLCVYAENNPICPWLEIWNDSPDNLRCDTIGQRLWWSPITIPFDAGVSCGSGIRLCYLFQEIGAGQCPDGYGYSKAYYACIPLALCNAADSFLGVN